MMRRFAQAPQTPAMLSGAARRGMLTGFNLFTRDVQRRQKVLKSRSLKEGSKNNMKTIAKLWCQLDKKERRSWNAKAVVARVSRHNDVQKKNSAFNLVMRVFAQGDGALLNAGNEKFTAMIAKRTSEALSAQQTNTVLKHFRIDPSDSLTKLCKGQSRQEEKVAGHYFRMVKPDMRLFTSFTEMQHAVAPTREAAFVNTHQVLRNLHVSAAGERSLKQRFRALPPEHQDQFCPISPQEAPAFETFCASKCTLHDPQRFDILSLFAEFRGVAKMARTPDSTQIAVYRSLAAMDRVRDGLYHKAHRILLRMRELRSSDCSVYIAATTPANATIPASAYAVDGGTLSDVDVARMLAETRTNHSVYDDVLRRAAVLRPAENRKVLEVYDVRSKVLKEAPVQLTKIKGPRSEKAVLARGKAEATRTAATAEKRRAKSQRQRTVTARRRPTTAATAERKASATSRKSRPATVTGKRRLTAQSRSRPARVGATKGSSGSRKKSAPRQLKAPVKLSAKARRHATSKSRAQKKLRSVAAVVTKSHSSLEQLADTKTVQEAFGTTSKEQKKGRGAAAKAPVSPPALATPSPVEESLLNEEYGLAEYDAFDGDEGDPEPTADPVVAKAAKAARAAKSRKAVSCRSSAKRRIRSVASILKGSKEPILLTSHIAPTKRKKKAVASPGAPTQSGDTTVNLLRKQLAGFL